MQNLNLSKYAFNLLLCQKAPIRSVYIISTNYI